MGEDLQLSLLFNQSSQPSGENVKNAFFILRLNIRPGTRRHIFYFLRVETRPGLEIGDTLRNPDTVNITLVPFANTVSGFMFI
jgi:hypothetical protein